MAIPDQAARANFRNFREFYPYYLGEHANRTCRQLHFIGSSLVLLLLAIAVVARRPALLLLVPVVGYGFAWVGHFYFERNKPATFTHPLWSLRGDWLMWWQMLIGRIAW